MPNYFLKMIQDLRQYEEVMLYGNLLHFSEAEQKETLEFLQSEYAKESTDYPFLAPDFDPSAALWGAKTIYLATQLMLYRENKVADIEVFLPDFMNKITPSALLSADLSLRFLPSVITHLKMIDPEDRLIEILEKHLYTWHFSGISYFLKPENLNFEVIVSDKCLYQLYINRVIEYKKLHFANHPALTEGIKANLSIFAEEFWKGFKNEITLNHD
jgi:hypothetical protein